MSLLVFSAVIWFLSPLIFTSSLCFRGFSWVFSWLKSQHSLKLKNEASAQRVCLISASWENDSQRILWNELIYAEIFWHQLDFSHFWRRSVWNRASRRYKSLHHREILCIFCWREILFWFQWSRKGRRGHRFSSSSVQQNPVGSAGGSARSYLPVCPRWGQECTSSRLFSARPHFLVRRWRNVNHTHTLNHRVSPGSAGGARGRRALSRVGL